MPRISDERRAATRRDILDGARTAFATHGYAGATVRLLEESTGLSRGAIFHHFADKQALFAAVADVDAARMARTVSSGGLVQLMRELPTQDQGWLGSWLEASRLRRTDPAFQAVWGGRDEALRTAAVARLERQQAAGVVRPDLSAGTLADLLRLLLDGLVLHRGLGLADADADAVLDLVEQLVRTGAASTTPDPTPRPDDRAPDAAGSAVSHDPGRDV